MQRTLFKYIMTEQAVPHLVSLFVLTVVIYLGRSLRYLEYFFLGGFKLEGFGKLFLYSLPYLFAFTIPLATLIAVLVTTLVGVIVAVPAVRIRGVQFAIVTFSAAVVFQQMVFHRFFP